MFLRFVHIKGQTTVLCCLSFDQRPRHFHFCRREFFSSLDHSVCRDCYRLRLFPRGWGWGSYAAVTTAVFIIVSIMAVWMAVPVCLSVGPPLWSKLKYLNDYQIDGQDILHRHSWFPEDKSY